jgi:hypothetical protein
MLTALTANPMGAIGYGLGKATGADEMRQLQFAEIYANLGNVMTMPVIGKQIEKQPAERELEKFPPESPARSPYSRARQAQQVADTQQRAAKSAAELDRPEVGGHGYADHGAHTTPAQQAKRVETGVAPSGRISPAERATRFDSHEAQLEAVGRARSAGADAPTTRLTKKGKGNAEHSDPDCRPAEDGIRVGSAAQAGP